MTIEPDGVTVTIAFSESVTGHTGFSIPSIALTYVSGDSGSELVYSPARQINAGEELTWDYSGDIVTTSNSLPVADASGNVINNSVQTGTPTLDFSNSDNSQYIGSVV